MGGVGGGGIWELGTSQMEKLTKKMKCTEVYNVEIVEISMGRMKEIRDIQVERK